MVVHTNPSTAIAHLAPHTNDRPRCAWRDCAREARAVFTIGELRDQYACKDHWQLFKDSGAWVSYVETSFEDGLLKLGPPSSHWGASPKQADAQRQKRRHALEHEVHPVYGTDLLSERLRIFDYSNNDFSGSRDELARAADVLYVRRQEWLRSRLETPLDLLERFRHQREVAWLRSAFVQGRKRAMTEAKRHELQLCPELLTVCVGSHATGHDPKLCTYTVLLHGCGQVIPQAHKSSHGGSSIRRLWCGDCAPVRQPHRKRRALADRRAVLLGLTS